MEGKQSVRTDLAMEAVELRGGTGRSIGTLEGVALREFERNGIPVTEVKVLDERGAQSWESQWAPI